MTRPVADTWGTERTVIRRYSPVGCILVLALFTFGCEATKPRPDYGPIAQPECAQLCTDLLLGGIL